MQQFVKAGFLASVVFFGISACQSSETQGITAESSNKVESLDAAAGRIEADIRFLADDARAGREAGSQGYLEAADYVANHYEEIGLLPLGDDGSYFQDVPLRSSKRDLDAAYMALNKDGATTEFEHLEDYLIGLPASGQPTDVSAEMVFVGYGIVAPDFGINDYEGVDADGKIVVVLTGTSADMPSDVAAHYSSSTTRRKIAQDQGAVGYISVYDKAGLQRFPWDRMKNSASSTSMSWIRDDDTTFSSAPGVRISAVMSPETGEMLFDGAEKSLSTVLEDLEAEGAGRPAAFDLKGTVTIRGSAIVDDIVSPNVVGYFPGSDPALKDEYVILSAHLDHTGVRDSDDPAEDVINNGALDNASGTASMLEAARMLSQLAEKGGLRRSIIIAAVTAEEKGLLGSEYLAYNPPVPIESIVGNVNLDMPLILYPFVDVIAFGADHSSLGETVRVAAAEMDVEMIPDPIPQLSIFTRSDHYRFVQQGIPAVFLFTGFGNGGEEAFNNFMNTRYHRPGDDLTQDLDFFQGARFAKLNYLITKSIANSEQKPSWNDGDFFGELYGR